MVCTGQDLIITTAGDSIKCLISAVREKKLHFTVQEDDRKRNRTIERALVASYRRAGFAPVDQRLVNREVQAAKERQANDSSLKRMPDQRWTLNTGVGWCMRTGIIAKEATESLRSHYAQLRSGIQFNGTVDRLIYRKVGIGLSGSYGRWSNGSFDVEVAGSNGAMEQVDLHEDVSIGTVGPTILWRPLKPEGTLIFLMILSGGYTWWKDVVSIDGASVELSGSSLYASLRIGWDVRLSKHFTLGAGLGFTTGVIERVLYDAGQGQQAANLPPKSGEDLRRLDLGLRLGLSF